MGINIHYEPRHVPPHAHRASVCLDIVLSYVLFVGLVDVVLGADVHVTHQQKRDPGDRIVPVRDAIVATGLSCDVTTDLASSDAGRTEAVQ